MFGQYVPSLGHEAVEERCRLENGLPELRLCTRQSLRTGRWGCLGVQRGHPRTAKVADEALAPLASGRETPVEGDAAHQIVLPVLGGGWTVLVLPHIGQLFPVGLGIEATAGARGR